MVFTKALRAMLGVVMAVALMVPQASIAWAVEGDGATDASQDTALLEAQSAGVAAPLEAQATQDGDTPLLALFRCVCRGG